MNTSLKSAPPFIWRSGRTSTPGACMSITNAVRPACFSASGSVRASRSAYLRVLRAARPHLLAVHDPLVTVANRARRERRQVRAAARLAEQLTPLRLAGEHPREVTLLLVLAAVGEHRRRALAGADRVEGAAVRRRAGFLQPVVDDRLEVDRGTEPAVPGWVVHPRQSGVVLRSEEHRRLGGRGRVLGEQPVEGCEHLGFVDGRDHGGQPDPRGGSLNGAARTRRVRRRVRRSRRTARRAPAPACRSSRLPARSSRCWS